MPTDIFLDTSYAVALYIKSDQYHVAAVDLSKRLEQGRHRIVTTIPVIFEIGSAFSSVPFRQKGSELLDTLSQDPLVETVPITDRFYNEAVGLFNSRKDKNWSLTDCYSFAVMRERGLEEALTSDIHFKQAGGISPLATR
jgi:predicted nucleic acid-binding protein